MLSGALQTAYDNLVGGRSQEALELVATEIAEHPYEANAHVLMSTALAGLGNHQDARKAVHRALVIEPGNALGLWNLSLSYHGTASPRAMTQAQAWLQRVVATAPGWYEPQMRLAVMLGLSSQGPEVARGQRSDRPQAERNRTYLLFRALGSRPGAA